MTITLGSWFVPLLLTLFCFYAANGYKRPFDKAGYFYKLNKASFVRFVFACIASFVIWAAYSLIVY